MTIIVSIMIRKGGATKTTLAKNITDECSRRGLSTILVDADSQGNASDGVNVTPRDAFAGLIKGEIEWNDAMIPVPDTFTGDTRDNYWIVPSYDGQTEVENDPATPTRIYDCFQEARGYVDVIICDCSPALTNVHTGLLFASDYLLLPTTCEYDSVMSIERTLGYLAKEANSDRYDGLPRAAVLGIVPNRLGADERVQQKNSNWLIRAFAEYTVFPAIRDKSIWRRASQFKRSIHAMTDSKIYSERQDARIAYGELLPVSNAVIEKAKAAV